MQICDNEQTASGDSCVGFVLGQHILGHKLVAPPWRRLDSRGYAVALCISGLEEWGVRGISREVRYHVR